MSKFKAGDLVYYPPLGNGIYRLEETAFGMLTLRILKDDFLEELFRADGKIRERENQQLLEQARSLKLEDAPPKPTSSEIIQAMLNKGEKSVPCWVSDCNEQPNASCPWAYIKMIIKQNDKILFMDERGVKWKYATPFDPKTDQPITELPE